MLAQLKKLKGRNLAELSERGRQAAYAFAERSGLSWQGLIPTDTAFLAGAPIDGRPASPHDLLEHFRQRKTRRFYASFDAPDVTVAELRNRFPNEEREIIREADRICNGYFDLLGFEGLYFGGKIPSWHLDPVSNVILPKVHWSKIEESTSSKRADTKVIWELNRHQYFCVLGRAYWLTKNEKYVETWIAHMDNWYENNPPKSGVNWLSSLEIAFRSISWIWVFHFFKDSPNMSPEIFVRMLKILFINGKHLETYLSTYFSPNTHLTGEALGMYFIGSFMPEVSEAKRWKASGYEILMNALDFQVSTDGVYCEQSSHYHRYTTDFYANLAVLRGLEGKTMEPKHREKLNGLFDCLLHMTQPDGESPLYGDDDGGRLNRLDSADAADFRPALALGSALLGRGDLKFAAGEPSAELLWILGPQGVRDYDAAEPIEPEQRSRAFLKGGLFSARSSWKEDADFILIDCGEHGFLNGGHAHADALNFVLSISGHPVLVDSGTYNYISDPEARNMFRESSAHNCLTVNGKSSSQPAGHFSWHSAANTGLLEWADDGDVCYLRGTHDGFEQFGVKYEREITFKRNRGLILVDSIKSISSNWYELNFILAPEYEAEINGMSVRVISKIPGQLTPLILKSEIFPSDQEGIWTIEKCQVSRCYGSKTFSKKLILSLRSEKDFSVSTVIMKDPEK